VVEQGDAYGTGVAERIRYVLALLRRNLWLIVTIIAASLALATVITMLMPPLYTAESSIQINDQGDQVLGDDMEARPGNLNWDVDRFLNTQLDILRSRALAERVARKLNLGGNAQFFTAMGADAPDAALRERGKREIVRELLQGGLNVELPPSTRIATIRFTSADPAMSAKIANAFAAEFIQANLQRRYDSSSYARNFVAEQLEEARARLETSERELNAYARRAGLIRTRDLRKDESDDRNGSITVASLMQLNEAANEAKTKRVAAQAQWNAEQAGPLLSSQSVLSSSAVQQLMTQRADLEAQLLAARARYLPDHPAVQKLGAELSAVRQQLNQTASDVRESIRAQYVAAQTAEERLKTQVSELRSETLAEQDRSVRYNTLAREADTNRSIYDGLLQRYRELNAAAGISSSNISIIDSADAPLVPSAPSFPWNLGLALLLALIVSGAVVLMRDQLEDKIRAPEDIEQKVGLPLLGVIPMVRDGEPAEALADPKSPISEAYNSLRGSLSYSTAEGLPHLLMITSAEPAEGKTTTSFAIARSFALAGKRVVLIDADLRRPSVHRLAGASNRKGLSSLLTGQETMEGVVIPSGQDNLSLVPSGPLPASPTELLGSPRMAALLEQFGQSFELVVIDSPPVLGLADSPVLSALADGVVMVIEAERGRRGMVKTSLRRLRGMHPVILGAVFTKFDSRRSASGSSAYYSYEYYRYGGEEANA
jgi:capsular exopolysaccharide synthesis family protein